MKELLRKVKKLEIKTRKMVESTFAGEYHSAFKGQGLEFDEVRLYQFGDDIRSIDWNVTAKTGQVYIKQFREEREQTMFVLFDVSGSEDFGSGFENKLLVGTEIAAILSFSAMKNSDKIGLATFSDRIERFFSPKKGRSHILSIIRGLLQHKREGSGTNINAALDFIKKTLKRRAILFIVSDFLDENYEKSLQYLSRKHDLILIHLFNPQEILTRSSGIIPVRDMESGRIRWMNSSATGYGAVLRAKFQQKQDMLENLAKRHNIDYLRIDTSRDHIQDLESFFRKRNARKKTA